MRSAGDSDVFFLTWDIERQKKVVCRLIWLTLLCRSKKTELLKEGYDQVEEVMANYNMGFITNQRDLHPCFTKTGMH
ncbi:MAG: hypothetical protein V8S95_04285 [Odoribacter sp.]